MTEAVLSEDSPSGTFTEIQENEYRGSARRSGMMAAESMPCECRYQPNSARPLSQACGPESECINRLLLLECGADCPTGRHCQNRRFARRDYADVHVVETPGKGHGLFTRASVKSGQFIMEYIGEVLSRNAFLKRSKKYSEDGASHFYFMTLTQEEVIDASTKGNISRFMNHSCNPNCTTQKWIVGSSTRIGLFAMRDIYAGAELTFDYKFECFGRSAQVCRCGEPNCKGFIGTTKSSTAAEGEYSDADAQDSGLVSSSSEEASPDGDVVPRRRHKKERLGSRSNHGIDNPDDVPKILQQIMHAERIDTVLRYFRIFYATNANTCLRRFIYLHGLQILHAILQQYKQHHEVIYQALRLAKKLPVATKNSVVDSKLESSVSALVQSSDATIANLAASIIDQWSSLEVVFKIPKAFMENSNGTAGALDTSPSSPPSRRASLYAYSELCDIAEGVGKSPPFLYMPGEVPKNPRTDTNVDRREESKPSEETMSPMAPNGLRLPLNWRYSFDANGTVFYFNIVTNLTQWEFPDDPCKPLDSGRAISNEAANPLPFKADESLMQEAIFAAREKMRALHSQKELEQQLGEIEKENYRKMKTSMSDTVVKFMSQFKGQIEHEEFKRLARKLTHTLAEKEARSRSNRGKVLNELEARSKKKIKIYLKEYLTKLGYRKPDSVVLRSADSDSD